MDNFKFIEETHEYFLNDIRIPSVSNIISPLVDYSHIDKDMLANKAALGTEFHRVIGLHFIKELDVESIDDRLILPYRAFCEWEEGRDLGISQAVEVKKYHKRLLFAGTPDLVTDTDLYDFKLRIYNKITDPLQLAGYALLVDRLGASQPKSRNRWVVSFDLKGNYKVHSVDHIQADGMFRKMLEHYNSEQEFNNLLNKWRKNEN